MSSTYLTRTFTATGNRKIFTTSFWVKRSGLSSGQSPIFSSDFGNSNNTYSMMYFTNDFLAFYSTDNGTTLQFLTNQKFRDVNGWYHIVITFDTTQTTASNRVKFYVNGEQITSFDTATYPPLDADNTWFNRNREHVIGRRSYDGANYFDGSISHFNFIDGTAYDASYFGSTDSVTGEWKINTSPSVTYGTNGFFILKDGNSVTDQSGEGNDFTVGGGTLTKTEDNPSNVFATWNTLDNFYQESTFQYGNTEVRTKSPGVIYSYETYNTGTIGVSSGKWYWEIKFSAVDSGASQIGIVDNIPTASTQQLGGRTYGWSYNQGGSISNNGGSVSGSWASYTTGDIIGIALNLDDNELTFYKNGAVQNSGTALSITASASTTSGFYLPAGGDDNAGNVTLQANFGNGYFGTTAVSSAGTNASGNGIFEYDVPTGFTALSTKGLNL